MSNAIRRIAPNLRRAGVTVDWIREGKQRDRVIAMVRDTEITSAASVASANGDSDPETLVEGGAKRTIADDGGRSVASAQTGANGSDGATHGMADEADGISPLLHDTGDLEYQD